jgi:demethylmenaquinone methyltransferase / 2-methoxy-6-polyprenyl-1,4-benzoquinol methylase
MEDLPTGPEKARLVREMFDRIAPRYDLVNRTTTFGMDVGWRRRAIRSLRLPARSLVLDVACGTGDLCRELQRTGYGAVGLDVSWGMLRLARGCTRLVQADALQPPFHDGAVDGITCGFALRNVVDLDRLFGGFTRMVRPGGRLALLEVDEPTSRVARAGHDVYFRRIVPLIGRVLSDREAYEYLPRSTEYLPRPPRLRAMLQEAGFSDIERESLAFGAAQLVTATRAT